MFRFKPTPKPNHIDLETIRETIAYIRDDVAADPALSDVASALEQAVFALDSASESQQASNATCTPIGARIFTSRL